jgi:hypothetical protein
MEQSTPKRPWIRWFTAGLLFVVTLWWIFPLDQLEMAIQNTVNRRLPEPAILKDFTIRSPRSISGTVVYPIGSELQFPFHLTVSPGVFGEREVHLLSPPDSVDNDTPPLVARYRFDSEAVNIEASQYSLSNILSGQEGTVTGTVSGTIRERPEATLKYSLTTEPLVGHSPVPPLAHGLTITKFTGTGQLKGRQLRLSNLDFKSDQFHFTGKSKIQLARPFENTTVEFDLKLTQPVEQTLNKTLTLGDLGL